MDKRGKTLNGQMAHISQYKLVALLSIHLALL